MKLKPLKEIQIGSRAFFSKFPDFESKENDVLLIMDHLVRDQVCFRSKIKGADLFLYKNMTKQEWIDFTLRANVPMKAGSFLVPEFCEYIGFTVEELDLLKDLFENMDPFHTYETLIYRFYKQNGGFFMTDEQLEEVYSVYKSSRAHRKEKQSKK
jgi:hypothetical protein